MKTLDGNSIEVQVGSGSTLYVCNFPPTADEAWMRDKFQKVCIRVLQRSWTETNKLIVRRDSRHTVSVIKVQHTQTILLCAI